MNTLPQRFYKLFWDVQPENLNVQTDAVFILERLLEMGDDAAIHWVRSTYPEEVIKNVVKTSRRLSRKTARFWQAFWGGRDQVFVEVLPPAGKPALALLSQTRF